MAQSISTESRWRSWDSRRAANELRKSKLPVRGMREDAGIWPHGLREAYVRSVISLMYDLRFRALARPMPVGMSYSGSLSLRRSTGRPVSSARPSAARWAMVAPASLATFEFSQNLVERWRGSNSAQKRELLEVASSNRKVSDVTLVLEKRRPFDFLVERPFLQKSRGERR